MSLGKISVFFGALFASSVFLSRGVAGLDCFHCVFVEGVDAEPGDEYGIPHDSTCANNPHSELSVNCLTLIYGMRNNLNKTEGGKGVVSLVSEAFKDLGQNSNQLVELTRQNAANQSLLQFTCAKMRFTGNYTNLGKNMITTIRSCIPTLRPHGFEAKCHSNELGKLQGQSKDEEVNMILENYVKLFGNESQTVACTCNENKCNGNLFGNETLASTEASNSTTTSTSTIASNSTDTSTITPNSTETSASTKAPSSDGKGGVGKAFSFSVATLSATFLFVKFL